MFIRDFYAYSVQALPRSFLCLERMILQACVEKKYGGIAPKKPLISKVRTV